MFEERYGICWPEDSPQEKAAADVLIRIAEVRKCYLKGQEPDYDRAARLVLEDFRSGRLGRITLERPEGQ